VQYQDESYDFVVRQVSLGRKLKDVLDALEIPRSTFSSWRKKREMQPLIEKRMPKPHPLRLTDSERNLIVKTKQQHPDKRHRHIQGLLQNAGVYISPTSVFKVLKEHGLVEPFERRECPWKKRRYEVPKRNLMWGTDWTKIKIAHETWHLATVIDFFSRLLVDWMIVPEMNSGHVKELYKRALLSQNLQEAMKKPRLRADLGAPNTSRAAREFLYALTSELPSYARVRRPTDNAITERFYQTIKQEEVYIVGSYPDLKSANEEIAKYIAYYNDERPHQALWNFTPSKVHEINNKSLILAELEELKLISKRRRREYWSLRDMIDFQRKTVEFYQAAQSSSDDTLNLSISSNVENA
jgi:transposase InsO family protein